MASTTKRELEGRVDTQIVLKKKRCTINGCRLNMGHIHEFFTRKLLKEVAMELRSICDENCFSFIKLNRLTVLNSNATDRYSFSKAFCSISENDDEHSFGCLFKKGLRILIKYLDMQEMPSNAQERHVLDTLLHFILKMTNEDAQAPFQALEGLGETDINIILTNHLFGKLSTSSSFLIDKQYKAKGKTMGSCPCLNPECKSTGRFGDTGIGNPSVWHGNVGVIDNNEVVVEALEDEPDSESPERTPKEVKIKSACLSRNSQMIAETVVFSFLQKKRHPEYCQYLFPCIGVNSQEMVVYFYDAEYDVLLESSPIPLHVTQKSLTGNVSVVAIIVSWLVVNHQYLCDGLTQVLKKTRSGFFHQAEKRLFIYENELQFGNIERPCLKPKKRFSLVSDPSMKEIEEERFKVTLKKT